MSVMVIKPFPTSQKQVGFTILPTPSSPWKNHIPHIIYKPMRGVIKCITIHLKVCHVTRVIAS